MSTAGKVLVVLVLLTVPIWIVLMSAVADLNNNGTKAVQAVKVQVAKLEQDVAKTEHEVSSLKDEIDKEQVVMGEDLAVIRSRQTSLERAKSEAIETEARVKLQLDELKLAVKTAETDRDHRIAELKKEKEDKATAEALVVKLKSESAQLLSTLTRLRNEFKSTLQANRELTRHLATGKRPAKPVSFVP